MSYTSMRGFGCPCNAPIAFGSVPAQPSHIIDAACPENYNPIFDGGQGIAYCLPDSTKTSEKGEKKPCPDDWTQVGSTYDKTFGVRLGKCVAPEKKFGLVEMSIAAAVVLVGVSLLRKK